MVDTEAAFRDSSALVPLCSREPTSFSAEEQFRRHTPVVWWATVVEVSSAIARSLRSGSIDDREARQALASLDQLRAVWEEIFPNDGVRDEACRLLGRYPLRAADSLQLAAAMVWRGERPAGRVFLRGGKRLGEAAESAGFSVIEL